MPPSPVIVWFRRDLRTHDHDALAAGASAAGGAGFIPLFVLDPVLLRGRAASPNRAWFLLGSLAALRGMLRDLGTDLVVRVGDPRTVVPEVVRATGARAVFVSRDHAPYGRARDRAVAAALDALGATWHPRRSGLVHEPEAVRTADDGPFRVYSPFARAWTALPRPEPHGPPTSLPGLPSALDPGTIPSLADLGLGEAPSAAADLLPRPGEPAARDRLDRWLDGGLTAYAKERDRLDHDGTSGKIAGQPLCA